MFHLLHKAKRESESVKKNGINITDMLKKRFQEAIGDTRNDDITEEEELNRIGKPSSQMQQNPIISMLQKKLNPLSKLNDTPPSSKSLFKTEVFFPPPTSGLFKQLTKKNVP